MLAAAVFDALVHRDQSAFAALIIPDRLALSACPEGAERAGKESFMAAVAKGRASAVEAFATCSAREEWREARDLKVAPSSRLEVQKCGRLNAWRSVRAEAVVYDKDLSFRVNEVVEVDGRFYFIDFSCSDEATVTLGGEPDLDPVLPQACRDHLLRFEACVAEVRPNLREMFQGHLNTSRVAVETRSREVSSDELAAECLQRDAVFREHQATTCPKAVSSTTR